MPPRISILAGRHSTLATFFLLFPLLASAQVQTGTPPFGSFGGGPDVVNLANLNSHITVPVRHKAGRGMDFTYDLSYDSSVWYPVGVSGSQTWQPVANWGWRGQTEVALGYISYTVTETQCLLDPGPPRQYGIVFHYKDWVYHDSFGVSHGFGIFQVVDSDCSGITSVTKVATDGSGYTLTADGNPSATVTSTAGKILNVPLMSSTGTGTATDRNGNQITVNSSGVFTDTLGTTALTVSGLGTPTSPLTFTYTAPSGASASVKLNYSAFSVQTAFGCGIAEYGPTTVNLVTSVTLPDDSPSNPDKYVISYEPTPGVPGKVTGRIVSITLPTGGTITYAYTGGSSGHITCADGSTSGLTRTLSDGAGWTATWQYDRALVSGTHWKTTITDPTTPTANQTVIDFQGIYETERKTYQGSSTSGTLLQTVGTCYNGVASPCLDTAITLPITQRKVITILPGGLQSEHDDLWNTYGMPTELDDYDFGAAPHGSLLKKILATYAALGNNIHAFRQSVTVQNAQAQTVSQVNYNYDETAVVATSGTPQHIAVTGIRGNLTSTKTYKQAGVFLTESFTNFDTGNVKTETDVNNAQTTFNYPDATSTCGNAFPTSVTLPITSPQLTRSMAWNCTGAVELTGTDENGKTTTTAYSDAYFWRPASVTDPSNAVTNLTYVSPTRTETALTFNAGSSALDRVVTLDGLGRPILNQTRQAPGSSNFDSVETDYDSVGRAYRVTLPYVGTLGQKASPAAPGTTTTFDALGRPLTVSDSGGGSTTYSYAQNDILVTSNPAPTGENTKRRQLEFDGLGELTSVCELTGAAGSGACAQTVSQTGYWTRYAYDAQGNLSGVTQNAQSGSTQSRTYSYDWMGRLLSENNPESGSATYVYDTAAGCTGTYNGDLVKRTDAVGNVTCSTFDALHRQLSITYPSGPYASATPKKYFVYDTATINTTPTPTTMVNVKARLAEAYTCLSSCSSKITDISFSYTARGETSDVYENTPNSGGYYHLAGQYWENGTLKQFSGLPGLPTTISYGPDGQGRGNTVSASSGQSPLASSTAYNSAGLPTAINLGSGAGDQDSFTYDTNTNRMTQYQFTVNGTSLNSTLTWNANGMPRTQNITDAFNSANTQNCMYQYDDLSRVGQVDCGTNKWGQSFGYDPFGNITKTVLASHSGDSFQPTYDLATNRIQTLPGNPPFVVTYDANGNVLNDSLHVYTWDAEGRPLTVDGVGLTYDALGRMVEQNRSGSYTQIVYAPNGQKLALMNAQTLQKALVPLPGNATAVYNSSGLLYYAHADMLGSIRLGTTPARSMYFDVAYAPFGETYAQSGSVDPAYTGQMADTSHRQDTSGGLYDFPLREYSVQGRWPSPDPAGNAAACPSDPQTQNRYAYVRNNPISFIDPLGAQPCDPTLDPFCDGRGGGREGNCDPRRDVFCFPIILPPLRGGGGGGGGRRERPPRLNLALIPPGLFSFPGREETHDRHLRCEKGLEKCLSTAVTKLGSCAGPAIEKLNTCLNGCVTICTFAPPWPLNTRTCIINCQDICNVTYGPKIAACGLIYAAERARCYVGYKLCRIGVI